MIVRLDEDDDCPDLESFRQHLIDGSQTDAEEDGHRLLHVDVQLFQLSRKLKQKFKLGI